MRLRRDESGEPEPVAEGLSFPAGIAVDPGPGDVGAIYVTESANDREVVRPPMGTGRLLRIAK